MKHVWRGGRSLSTANAGWQARRARRSEPDWQTRPTNAGAIRSPNAATTTNFNDFQSIPIIFWGIMKRSAENLNGARLTGWAVFVGSERWLAGESGGTCVRPPATAVQNTLVAAGVALGGRHDVPGAGNDKRHEV